MKNNKGNILFIILIAIGLFALLGSVVMDGETTSNKIGEDKAKLYAQDILNYANAMENTVQKMMANGVRETDLCFDIDGTYPGGDTGYEHAGCATEANKVFSPQGGGAKYMIPPAEYFDPNFSSDGRTGLYLFAGTSDVINLPYGTNESGESDLLLLVYGLKKPICDAINSALNWGPKDAPPIEPATATPGINAIKFKGAYTKDNQIGDTADPTKIYFNNNPKGCFQSSNSGNYSDGYVAYFALHIR